MVRNQYEWRLDMAIANLLNSTVDVPPDGFDEYYRNLKLTGRLNGWTA